MIEIEAPRREDDPSSMSDADLAARLRDHVASHAAWRRRRIDETAEDEWGYTHPSVDDDEERVRTLVRRSLDQAIATSTAWADELHRVARHDRTAALERIARLVDPATLNGVLAVWWPELESTHRLGHDEVVRLFRRAGYVSDNDRVADSPTYEMTIYRGTDRPDRDAVRGVSWTIEPDTARWYAKRFNVAKAGSFGWLWRATVDPDDVLGRFWGYAEREVVVDPRRLRGLALVELVPGQVEAFS